MTTRLQLHGTRKQPAQTSPNPDPQTRVKMTHCLKLLEITRIRMLMRLFMEFHFHFFIVRNSLQIHRSYLISCVCVCVCVCVCAHTGACSVMSDSLSPCGLQSTRLLCPWNFPSENAGVGCHVLLQGIFPTQGLNSCLLHWQVDSLPLGHQGSHLIPLPMTNNMLYHALLLGQCFLTVDFLGN